VIVPSGENHRIPRLALLFEEPCPLPSGRLPWKLAIPIWRACDFGWEKKSKRPEIFGVIV
jgi:hypothetical protein